MGATTNKNEGRLRQHILSQFFVWKQHKKIVAEYSTPKTASAYVVAENVVNDFGEILPQLNDCLFYQYLIASAHHGMTPTICRY
jgi:hypothetical protein